MHYEMPRLQPQYDADRILALHGMVMSILRNEHSLYYKENKIITPQCNEENKMVWIKEKGKPSCNKRTHHTTMGRPYVMERRKGGHGTKRKYI